MKTLSPTLRKQLERAIVDARDVAETGARAALEALAVHHHEPCEHMSAEQRGLRRRLRAHGRQLGDRQDARSGSQAIDRLVHECACEHWHGMLFARFLAENRLLIEPELGVAVTLEECEDLGKEAGADKWTMAAHFAHRMLPHVFRPAHPAFEVQLAREHRLRLEGLAESLPAGVFAATDALGWVYQFWQSRKKDEVNRSEVKIGADELPAVTQLFTEPYMVRFLLDNSLGAWWAAHRVRDAQPCARRGDAARWPHALLDPALMEVIHREQSQHASWPARGLLDAGELRPGDTRTNAISVPPWSMSSTTPWGPDSARHRNTGHGAAWEHGHPARVDNHGPSARCGLEARAPNLSFVRHQVEDDQEDARVAATWIDGPENRRCAAAHRFETPSLERTR